MGDAPFEQTLDAMLELSEQGKVRHVGLSNFTSEQVERALEHAPVFANQVEYDPFLGQRELVGLAVKHDRMVTAYSPWSVVRCSTMTRWPRSPTRTTRNPLRWRCAGCSRMTVSAIPKSTSPQHIASNVAALDLDVDDDELRRIDGLDRGLRLIDPPFAAWWRTVRRGTPRPP